MKIIFLVDFYYPNFSAVSKCVYNLINEFEKKNEVIVISLDSNKQNNKEIIKLQNHFSIKLYDEEFYKRKIYGEDNNNRILTVLNKVRIFNFKIKGYLKSIIYPQNIRKDRIKKYKKQLEEMDLKDDIIIPVCLPFEAILASLEYKKINNKIILIPLLFDKFTNNETLHRLEINKKLKMERHLKLEHNMLIKCDKIFAMNQLKNNFIKFFPDFVEQILFIEHPLLQNKIKNKDNKNNKSNKIRISYCGTLYKKLRSPDYVLKIFEEINLNYELNFYSAGDCEKKIFEYQNITNFKIKRNGFKTIQEIEKIYKESDILLSIGNYQSTSTPSKIFEYISLGKPIIHFYTYSLDPVIQILQKYPLGILIKENQEKFDLNKLKIEKFCLENKGKKITYGEISKKYEEAIPINIVQLIEKEIKNIKDKRIK